MNLTLWYGCGGGEGDSKKIILAFRQPCECFNDIQAANNFFVCDKVAFKYPAILYGFQEITCFGILCGSLIFFLLPCEAGGCRLQFFVLTGF